MSTEYTLSDVLSILESSDTVTYWMDNGSEQIFAGPFTENEFKSLIIRQIEILSYISSDPDEVLKRFNVKYGDNS